MILIFSGSTILITHIYSPGEKTIAEFSPLFPNKKGEKPRTPLRGFKSNPRPPLDGKNHFRSLKYFKL
jgi:hypothetical protein